MSSTANNRTVNNIKITARFHSRFWLAWALGCAIPLLILHSELYIVFSNHVMTASGEDPSATVSKMDSLRMIVPQFVAMFACLTGIYLMSVHRISGPLINIKRSLDRIAAGETDVKLKFRKADRLDDIADSFNRAMAVLGKK